MYIIITQIVRNIYNLDVLYNILKNKPIQHM